VVHGVWHYQIVGTWLGLQGSDVPYFVILHGMLHEWFRDAHPVKHLKKLLFWRVAVQKAVQTAASVLFLCEEEHRIAPAVFNLQSRAEAIVPLGIAGPPAQLTGSEWLTKRFPELKNKRLVVYLGRICRSKACDTLLRAFAATHENHSDLRLVISGPDFEGWQPDLMRLADELGIGPKVVWTGPVYGDQKWEVLRAAELFVLPSHCETFPVSVLESLAAKTPVLLTNKVGIYREIRDDRAGLVCEDNEHSLESSLRAWLSLNGVERETFRHAAFRCFQARFERSAAIQLHLAVLRQFIALRTENLHAVGASIGGNRFEDRITSRPL
jgi:glycosyltransferase involved in cell wall biosynthesis